VTDSGAEGAGTAYLIFGRPGTDAVDLSDPGLIRLTTGVAGDQAGVAVAATPDMDGDGRPEAVIGAARADEDRGAAFVVFSSHLTGTLDLANADIKISGPPGGRAGLAVAGSADMNGDGRGEIVVGAPQVKTGDRVSGQGFVVFGRNAPGPIDLANLGAGGFAFNAAAEDRFLGLAVAGVGDLTGDGIPDVAFGAPGASRNERAGSGSVYVVAGKASPDAAAPAFRLDGGAVGDALGAAITAGDVNGDGLTDLAATAPFSDALSRDDAGGVYILLGTTTPANVDGAALGAAGYRLAGSTAGGTMRSVAALGDLDGDGTTDLLTGAHGKSLVHLVLGTKPVIAGPPDPGVEEEKQAGCTAADNVEMLIDDSGSMEESDPQLLRRQAVELVIAKPRNQGEVLGAYEFGDTGDQLFEPQEILPRGPGSNQTELFKALEDELDADNGGTDYNLAFTGVANDNPAAQARIFVTDGEHNVGEFINGHRNGPPTYVIGLNIGTKGEAAERLQRIADETKARYYPNVTAQQIQSVINRIDSRLNCDVELDTDVDTLTEAEPVGEQTAELESDAHAYDVDVTWGEAADRVVPERIALEGANGRVVTAFGGERLQRALAHPGTPVRVGGVRLRASRRATSFGFRISGKQSRTLQVRYRMTKFDGRGARVTSQIAQSRRRN
jgi:hypothetical protein